MTTVDDLVCPRCFGTAAQEPCTFCRGSKINLNAIEAIKALVANTTYAQEPDPDDDRYMIVTMRLPVAPKQPAKSCIGLEATACLLVFAESVLAGRALGEQLNAEKK